jgi:alpha-N-acetylglucosamine transferase
MDLIRLHVFNMTSYKAVIYVDADVTILDELVFPLRCGSTKTYPPLTRALVVAIARVSRPDVNIPIVTIRHYPVLLFAARRDPKCLLAQRYRVVFQLWRACHRCAATYKLMMTSGVLSPMNAGVMLLRPEKALFDAAVCVRVTLSKLLVCTCAMINPTI